MTPYLNSSIKRREPFRPIAPAIRAKDATELLSEPNSCNQFMTQIGAVSEVGRLLLKNVVHVDGSVRAQLVNPDDLLGRVLAALASIGHGPFVCNTSQRATRTHR